MLSVLLSALSPPAPLKSLTFWRYTNQIIIIVIKAVGATSGGGFRAALRQLTASQFDLAGLVVHRVVAEDHVAGERQRQALAVEYRAVRRQSNESVGNGDRVEDAGLEIAHEHVGRPHPVELAMVQRDAAVAARVERQPVVLPDLTEVDRHGELLYT